MKDVEININSTDEEIEAALKKAMGDEYKSKVKDQVRIAKEIYCDENSQANLAAAVGSFLMDTHQGYQRMFLMLLEEKNKAKREDMAHDILHAVIDRLESMLEHLDHSMPCMRDEDEIPDDCTRH